MAIIDQTENFAFDIAWGRGDNDSKRFVIKDVTGAVVDISGFSFIMTVNSEKSPVNQVNQKFTIVGNITDGPNGKVSFTPAFLDTADLLGCFFYDIEQIDLSAQIKTLVKGRVFIEQDITKFPPAIGGIIGSNYDGSDYQIRPTVLTGLTNTKQGLLIASLLINAAGNATTRIIMTLGEVAPPNVTFSLFMSALNKIEIIGRNVADTQAIIRTATTAFAGGPAWRTVIASWDLATSTILMYVGDTINNTPTININEDLNYTDGDAAIGALFNGTVNYVGGLSELYFDNKFLDISIEANRRRIVDATGKLVYFGVTGELVSGTTPVLYAPNGNVVFNRGTGGNFTTVGQLDFIPGPGA